MSTTLEWSMESCSQESQLETFDDLVQDVFIRALSRLSTLRETASFGPWLVAIARNVANDYHRRSVPEEPLTDDASY